MIIAGNMLSATCASDLLRASMRPAMIIAGNRAAREQDAWGQPASMRPAMIIAGNDDTTMAEIERGSLQ